MVVIYKIENQSGERRGHQDFYDLMCPPDFDLHFFMDFLIYLTFTMENSVDNFLYNKVLMKAKTAQCRLIFLNTDPVLPD